MLCEGLHLLALQAAQVLRLVGARAHAHHSQQLGLDRRQVVAMAAAGALPLVLLAAQCRSAHALCYARLLSRDRCLHPCIRFILFFG